jgi:type VI protein secretion system component VasK
MNNMLEKTIREHAGEIFAGQEPAAGHRERFAAKLSAAKKRKRLRLYGIAGYAAAAAILTAVMLLSYPSADTQEESISEVRNYYSMQLENEARAVRQLLGKMDENERANVLKDIESIRNEAPPETEAPEVTIRVYQSKIEALQHIRHILTNNISLI